jgi:hypothetical protein
MGRVTALRARRTTSPRPPLGRGQRLLAGAGLALVLLAWDQVVGCGRGEDRPRIVTADPDAAVVGGPVDAAPDAGAGTLVTITPVELPDGTWAFEGVPDAIAAGGVVLHLVNPATGGHELRLIAPDGRLVAEVPRTLGGRQGAVVVDALAPGTYRLVDRQPFDDGTYADWGLAADLVVRASTGGATEPVR